MQVISHRGLWLDPVEKNQIDAFRRSFHRGLGVETDIRDAVVDGRSQLVVSHDPATGREMTLGDLLLLAAHMGEPLLALNVKADGLGPSINDLLKSLSYKNYFLFDHSVPDLLQCARLGLRCFSRMSEYERAAPLFDHPNVVGVWLDCFGPERWYSSAMIESIIEQGKSIALVAPDLHGRATELPGFLGWLRDSGLANRNDLIVCTDDPLGALDATKVTK